jgi:FYVE zinc finger
MVSKNSPPIILRNKCLTGNNSFFSSCCASRFTWASTSDSEAQEARDKHNCRSCGALVCHPCSKNLAPLSSIGLTVPVRVCDRCHYDNASSSVFPTKEDATSCYNDDEKESGRKPTRFRVKHSAIVDDLVSRVHASCLNDA